MTRLAWPLLVVSALALVPSAAGKEFRPGDLRACGPTRCVAVVDPDVLPRLASFFYTGPQPARTHRPRLGTPYFELRFRNGFVAGIAGARRLDRFLTYGVHEPRFRARQWYTVPRAIAAHLRCRTAGVRPFRLTRSALARSGKRQDLG